MTGEGHRSWLADVEFNPAGTALATCSGDGVVKLWDLATVSCSATLAEHVQAVWGVSWHAGGDVLATACMDHTSKLFDVHTGRVKQSLRGHVDSVNAVVWQPFSLTLATASGDKTISLWDARSGLCVQTFYGHTNAVNDVLFNLRGDMLASWDADGVVRVWDVRMATERGNLSLGSSAGGVNGLCMDRSAQVMAAACSDGSLKVLDTTGVCEAILAAAAAGGTAPTAAVRGGGSSAGPAIPMTIASILRGHEDSVQCCAFDPTSSYLVSAGNDCMVKVWADGVSATGGGAAAGGSGGN